MPTIHPTAIVDPAAELGDGVEIGPYCVVEADVKIGPGCRLREHVVIRRYTTLGRNNVLDAFISLGGEPQDYKFDPATVSYLRIGDDNIMREGVTISRGTGAEGATVVGSGCYWMVGSHAGHNVVVGDRVVLVNNVSIGGHAEIGSRAILSGSVLIHQFTWLGEMIMSQGNAGAGMHVPPYCLIVGNNGVAGLNSVGLQRAEHISAEDRRQIKEAFSLTYRSGLTPTQALAKMDQCADWSEAAGKFREFVRRVLGAKAPYARGLCPLWRRRHHRAD